MPPLTARRNSRHSPARTKKAEADESEGRGWKPGHGTRSLKERLRKGALIGGRCPLVGIPKLMVLIG